MKMKLLAATAALAMVSAAPAAHALVWTTQLDWSQAGHTNSPYGTVTVTEVDANDVQVKVALNSSFVDTGGHYVFTFNLLDTPDSTVTVDPLSHITAAQATYQPAFSNDPTTGSDYQNSPFGNWDNAWALTATGGNNTLTGPFIFDVHNANGITFGGTNPVYNHTTGQLISTGCNAGDAHCNTFDSNDQGSVPGSPTGGWWFSVDSSGSGGCTDGVTCVVAGRDAFLSTGVPEPAAWALMILGFGGIGATMRRRRTAIA